MSFPRVLATFALAACAVQPVFAHMKMTFPAPLRAQTDFDYTSPLSNDGSNFPCKGYAGDVPSVSTAVTALEAGKNFTVKIEGGAPHGGGSCQFSLSYDKGRSWAVLHSVVGGCPLAGNYSFTVPQGVPSASNVLFSWSWFNKVGNREMYQNCAAVDVQGGSAPLQLPKMFEANIFGGPCQTIEGTEVDFANPSGFVTNCPADKLVTPDQKVTLSPSGSPAGGANQQQQQPPDGSATESPSSTSTSSTPTSTGTPINAGTTPDGQSAGDDEEPCPPGTDDQDDGGEEEDCTEEDDGGAGDQQNGDGAPTVNDGDTVEGEASDNGDATPPPATPSSSAPSTPEPSSQPETSGSGSGACTPGAMLCTDGGQSWSMCAYGKWVPMGAVAPGTKCVNGQHVPATRRASSRIYGRSGLAPHY